VISQSVIVVRMDLRSPRAGGVAATHKVFTMMADTTHPLRGVLVLLVLAALTGCGGGEDDDDPLVPPPTPAVEIVNGSGDEVDVRWYPKEGQHESGTDVVPACEAKRVPVPAGPFTIVVSSPDGPASFGWVVTAEKACCIAIRRNGEAYVTQERPLPGACP
jgi:hypothetical protein